MNPVRCSFHVRTPEGYEPVNVNAPNGMLPTLWPPSIGDTVYLPGGMHEVVARQWVYASWGSMDWPHRESQPLTGPLLDIIVVPAEGVFRDER